MPESSYPWTVGSSGGNSGITKEDSSEAPVDKRSSSSGTPSTGKKTHEKVAVIVSEPKPGCGKHKMPDFCEDCATMFLTKNEAFQEANRLEREGNLEMSGMRCWRHRVPPDCRDCDIESQVSEQEEEVLEK